MIRKYSIFLLLGLLIGAYAFDVYGQEYGTRLGGRRGGEVTFEPRGPGVLFGALDPAMKKWYVPQELLQEYQWRSWEYTNYARNLYERYVDIALEGDYFYDLYGNFVTRGWLIYDWTQQQPQQFGSGLFKDSRFSSWFSRLLIASDSKGQYHYAITIGDQIRTTLTPMTFSKPTFNGIQWDFLSDKYSATFLLSRISHPGVGSTGEIPLARTSSTNLFGGRATAQVGDFVRVGATYINSHQSRTLLESFTGSPFTGMLSDPQNAAPISWIEILLSDDSPGDDEGGAAFFSGGSDILITDMWGNEVWGKDIGFAPIIEGGFQRVGYLAADGDETIRIRYDFTDPSYNGPDRTEIHQVHFRMVLSNDYRVQVTSDRQTNDENQPVFLLVTRAEGNVKDNSNQRVVAFDYGLPTANQIFGFTLEVTDVMGFDLYAEFDVNYRFRQYPNVNLETHSTSSGITGNEQSEAWMVNASKLAYPWFFFGEAFSMDDGYRTDAFLVDQAGAIDYEDVLFNRYEFVEDNDDQDRRPDWQRQLQLSDNEVFPGWDENNDFISDFNQNDNDRRPNLLPDYEEPFLRYNVDRPEHLFGIDLNNNMWIDRFENDELPDYPYKRDHRGYNAYVGVHITPDMRLTVGQLRAKLLSEKKQNITNYGLFTFDKDYAGLGRLRIFERLKFVKDNIPDNLFQWVQPPQSRGTQQRLEDPLLAQNTWVNTSWLGFDYTKIKNFNFINKVKWESYWQRDSKELLAERKMRSVDRFFGLINKADYTLQLGGVMIQPKWKSEYRRQTRDLVSDEERKDLTELLFLTLGFRILRKTVLQTGVEQAFFNDMLDDANDFRGTVLALQLTNVVDYQGYKVTTQMGFSVDRREFPELGEVETTGRSFVTVFAGVE